MTVDRMLVFDTETSGIRTDEDRIVQLYIGIYGADGALEKDYEWIINPGVPIADEAAEVHGFSNEYLAEHGVDAKTALTEAKDVFALYLDIPWVAFNLNFDLSILDSEFKRHGISTKFGEFAAKNVKLIDAIVIDRAEDKYRKGKRKLMNLAEHYGVPFDEDALHNAAVDVAVTAAVTRKVIDKYGVPTNRQQSDWYRTWAEGLEEYLRRTDPDASVGKDWPLRLNNEKENN